MNLKGKMPLLGCIYHYVFSLLLLVTGGATAQAQNAWGFESTSPAIYRLDTPVQQPFSAANLSHPPSELAKITAINVQISPSASAWVDSQICAQDLKHCQPITGGRLYTTAFNEFAATTSFYIVHQVRSWNGAYPPIYIKAQLNLWWK